ncbi:NHLP bacteriocin export ABC transporter permease/ATPase subunit [candidate division KSB3 bacterium]|uniref:NHLP bacteriocin export ABC transporter permease/ATPase subunit n=1 Tax=candidate division KSB3 bacterium TaxID=2044937 RepID=A0A9D5JYK7_9BACT|nr:NHLP bacteriocin export ABC transporter permease/ATPase subunit [candidate division KSB3 bacterium]MBD3326405.1 NHLP bacteriocin export ABC transporter permease/ATPase subunit [candidate division KSB3 bacterium]
MVTLICPHCGAKYQLDDAKLARFTKFRCTQCQYVSPLQENILPEPPAEAEESFPSEAEDEFARAEQMLEQLEEEQDIETIFKNEGDLIPVQVNKPLSMNTDESVWLVNTGLIDIFSVDLEQGQPIGPRRHLIRLEPGRLFCGIDSERHDKHTALIAVGSVDTSILQLERTRLHELAQQYEFSAIGISDLIDQWIGAVLETFKTEMIPKDCQILPEDEDTLELKGQMSYKPQKGVVWIMHQEGGSQFMGNAVFPEIRGEMYFPVSQRTWLSTLEPTTLTYAPTLNLVEKPLFWQAFEHFHLFLIESLIRISELEVQAETERLKRKAEDERLSFSNALGYLLSVVKKEKDFLTEDTADPLLSACRVVGNALNIKIRPHPDAQKGRNTLEDILRASRVKKREVLLRDNWWQQDSGPLLGYIEEDKRPVALIPKSSRSYILFDPVKKTRTKVTAKVADTLEGKAYAFYVPFPDHVLTWKDLLKLGVQDIKGDIGMVVLMGISGALLGLLTPVIIGIIFDTIIPGALLNQLYTVGVILLICAITSVVFDITKSMAMLRVEGKTDYRLQAALWDRLLALPIPFFRDYTAGDLAVRSLGINTIRQILAGVTIQSMLTAIFSVVYLGLLVYYDWFLALIALGISLLSVLVTSGLGYLFVYYQKPLNEIEGKLSGMILQLITGISKLRISGTEDRGFAVWANEFGKQRTFSLKARKVQNILATVNAIIPVCASMLFYYFVLAKILDPEKQGLSTGNLLAFLAAYGTFQGNLLQMSGALLNTLSIIPYYKRLKPILAARPEVDATRTHPGELSGDIEVTQVYFRYHPDGPLILDNVSLNIASGEFVAIVGGSGSGKSTLMRLLLGFESPETGTIYYDGQDLSKVDVLEVRRQIGVVLQNAQIMSGSIYENIVGAGAAGLTIADAWRAARMAGCDKDILDMPMGMHTMLPPGGGTLSGGQRQRIIIARAIIRKPRILFFDEATSALDNKTQAIVSDSIEQLQSTRIVIAHRLSTIMNADRIYVMEKGRLVQSGSYEELMNQEGLFAELAKRQLA